MTGTPNVVAIVYADTEWKLSLPQREYNLSIKQDVTDGCGQVRECKENYDTRYVSVTGSGYSGDQLPVLEPAAHQAACLKAHLYCFYFPSLF